MNNTLHKSRVDAIRSAYDKGLSHRAAAAHCGVSRHTIARYYGRWNSAIFGGEMMCIVKGDTKRRWKEEAERREMSVRELHSFIVETIAEENLFDAVMG